MTGTPLPDRRFLAPSLVAALLASSVVAAALVFSAERSDAEEANEALARQAAGIAERTVELTAASLRGGSGVLRRSGPMPERGFRRYARDIVSETPIPTLAWAPRVPARERARFERILGRSIAVPRGPTARSPKGDLMPAPHQDGAYAPIRFVHPDTRGPRRALGLDLYSEPVRAAAARRARDSGEAAITTPSLLPGRSEPTVLILDPVYAPGSRLANRRQRRRALAGFLRGSIAARAIEAELDRQLGAELDVAIADGEHELLGGEQDGAEGEAMMVDVIDHEWTVWVENARRASVLPALAVGAVGVSLAALVASLFALARRREQILSHERDAAASEAAAQRETASTLQQAFLPPSLPRIDGVETAALYAPGAEGVEVGGDFYDLFATGERWTAMIGDVSGKGAKAASITALVRHTARAVADRGLATAVHELNGAISRDTAPGTFATLCIASIDPGPDGIDLAIVVAGHPPPMIVRRGGVVEPIQPTAPLVGVLDELDVREAHARLGPGEAIFLYTDGLIEARRRGGAALGEERLRCALAQVRDADPDELIAVALARAREVSPEFPQDDVAILAIRAA